MMSAAVLAGGLGTRLRSVLSHRPKALAPVAGRHFLAYLLDQLADEGSFEQVVLCTGHLGDQIQTAFGDCWRKLHLQYSREPRPLGTAGALRYALDRFPSGAVLVLNGDSYCDLDLGGMASFHESRGSEATIALTEAPDPSRYGAVSCDPDGVIRGFAEKGRTGPGLINAGTYILSRRVIEAIASGLAVSLERDCFPHWIGMGLFGFNRGQRFLDIGTPSSLREAQVFFTPAGGFPYGGNQRPYALLDRDGTINTERHYLSHPDQLELLPGATDGMKKLRDLGLGLAIISNQSSIGRGYLDAERMERVHNRLRAMLGSADIAVDGIYYCPHLPQADCDCRKPRSGLVDRAASDLGFDPQDSFLIGDKLCDIQLGARIGATTFLVRTGYGTVSEAEGVRADHSVDNLAAAADRIASLLAAHSPRRRRQSVWYCGPFDMPPQPERSVHPGDALDRRALDHDAGGAGAFWRQNK